MENISVYAKISINAFLIDKRLGRQGLVFGNIAQVAKQYGITIEIQGKILKFSAPKKRLQMFAEKLHFAGVNFWE